MFRSISGRYFVNLASIASAVSIQQYFAYISVQCIFRENFTENKMWVLVVQWHSTVKQSSSIPEKEIDEMENPSLLILYGSETGTAQDSAERIWRQAVRWRLEPRVMAMDDYNMTQLLYEKLVVFVVATSGQGDPPSNMRKSWTFLLRRSLPSTSLENTYVAVLGLGDSSYTKFNFIAKKLHRRLTDGLGATALCSVGLADDQHDLGSSAVIDPWTSKLWQHIQTKVHTNLTHEKNADFDPRLILRWKVTECPDETIAIDVSSTIHNQKGSYFVSLVSNVRVTPENHFQDVRLLKFKCDEEESKFIYSPGDVAYLTPSNSNEAIDKFFSIFEENGFFKYSKIKLHQIHKGISIPSQLDGKYFILESVVRNYWDLNAIPSRSVFEVLSGVSSNELEKEKLTELSSPQGTQELYDYCNRPRRTILEVLADFPHSRSNITLDHLFDMMKPIRPRAFSIASSPLEDELMLLVAVVQYKTKLKAPRLGLCSNWLKNLTLAAKTCVVIKRGSMRFPQFGNEAEQRPIVMVGPGTGVAPFRSYVITEHIRSKGHVNNERPLILFFGSRNRDADFFFQKDWNQVISLQVFTAFSRDQSHKIYVQHVIVQNKQTIFKALFEEKGSLYVAGNSKDMPTAVCDAVVKCIVDAGIISEVECNQWLDQLVKENRYQQEVWS